MSMLRADSPQFQHTSFIQVLAKSSNLALALQKELEGLFESQNQSPRKDLTSIFGDFLARRAPV
jgi:hypothetical protein